MNDEAASGGADEGLGGWGTARRIVSIFAAGLGAGWLAWALVSEGPQLGALLVSPMLLGLSWGLWSDDSRVTVPGLVLVGAALGASSVTFGPIPAMLFYPVLVAELLALGLEIRRTPRNSGSSASV